MVEPTPRCAAFPCLPASIPSARVDPSLTPRMSQYPKVMAMALIFVL